MAKVPKIVLDKNVMTLLMSVGVCVSSVDLNYHKKTRGNKGGWCIHFGTEHLPFYANRKVAAARFSEDIEEIVQRRIDAALEDERKEVAEVNDLRSRAAFHNYLASCAAQRAGEYSLALSTYRAVREGAKVSALEGSAEPEGDWTKALHAGDVVCEKSKPHAAMEVEDLGPANVALRGISSNEVRFVSYHIFRGEYERVSGQ